jgi:mono/diheme cytochrome c family protein
MKAVGIATALLLALTSCARKPAGKAAAGTTTPGPSYELRLGRLTYQHYCQTCHGETGAGDGFNAYNLDPRPRDMSDPAFQTKKTDADLADAIRRGGAGVGLSALMLSPAQVDQVVLYIRSLRKH